MPLTKRKEAKMTKSNAQGVDPVLAKAEEGLVAKYGDRIVPGTVRRAPADSKYGTKLLVTSNTLGLDGQPDGNTREVATSDVWQVRHTEEVSKELRRQASRERRKAKASRETTKKAPKETTPRAKRTRKSRKPATATA